MPIIGGGVMGLMTAYYAAPLAEAVTVLERSWVGDARCSIEYTTARAGRRAALPSRTQSPGRGEAWALSGSGPPPAKRRALRICYEPVGGQEPGLRAGAQASRLVA